MATIKFHNGQGRSGKGRRGYHTLAALRRTMEYITREDKTETVLIRSVNCNAATAYDEMVLCKEMYGKAKEDGKNRMLIHFSQHFVPGETTPEVASEIAGRLLQHPMFDGFQVVYATHTDRQHLHTHFVVNTVNLTDGHKWQLTQDQMQQLKDYSDNIVREYGLYVVPETDRKQESYKSQHQVKEEAAGTSWKREIYLAVKACRDAAVDRETFIREMEKLGYQVNWSDARKYITFTDSEGHKLRNRKLYPPDQFTKEALEQRFVQNKEYQLRQRENAADHVLKEAGGILKLADTVRKMGGTKGRYPMQHLERTRNKASVRERMKEREKGSGLDWER